MAFALQIRQKKFFHYRYLMRLVEGKWMVDNAPIIIVEQVQHIRRPEV